MPLTMTGANALPFGGRSAAAHTLNGTGGGGGGVTGFVDVGIAGVDVGVAGVDVGTTGVNVVGTCADVDGVGTTAVVVVVGAAVVSGAATVSELPQAAAMTEKAAITSHLRVRRGWAVLFVDVLIVDSPGDDRSARLARKWTLTLSLAHRHERGGAVVEELSGVESPVIWACCRPPDDDQFVR